MLSRTEKENALWNSGSFIITSILGFFNFTLNYNSFNSEIFGLFLVISAVFGIGYTLDFGFGVSTIKHIAEAAKKADFELVNQIFVTFFFTFLSLSVFVLAGFFAYYSWFFTGTEIYLNNEKSLIFNIYLLLSIGFFFKYLSNYMTKVLEGFARFKLLSKINISLAVLNSIFIFSIFLFKLDIIYLPLFLSLNGVLYFVVLMFTSLHKINVLKFNLKYFNVRILKAYGAYNINIQFAFFVGSLVDPIVKFIIGNSYSLNLVTYYESAKKIIDLSNGLIYSSQKEVFIKLSESNVTNTLKEFIKDKIFIYAKLANYYSIFGYGVLNPLICILIFFWIGNLEPVFLFLIFLPAYSLINFGGSLYSVLMVAGRGGKLLIIQLLNVIFITSLLYYSILFTKSYLGLFGFYASIIINTFLILYFIVRGYNLELRKYFREVKAIELIKLNVLLVSQAILCISFSEYIFYILTIYAVIYFAVFFKPIILIGTKLWRELRNFKRIRHKDD